MYERCVCSNDVKNEMPERTAIRKMVFARKKRLRGEVFEGLEEKTDGTKRKITGHDACNENTRIKQEWKQWKKSNCGSVNYVQMLRERKWGSRKAQNWRGEWQRALRVWCGYGGGNSGTRERKKQKKLLNRGGVRANARKKKFQWYRFLGGWREGQKWGGSEQAKWWERERGGVQRCKIGRDGRFKGTKGQSVCFKASGHKRKKGCAARERDRANRSHMGRWVRVGEKGGRAWVDLCWLGHGCWQPCPGKKEGPCLSSVVPVHLSTQKINASPPLPSPLRPPPSALPFPCCSADCKRVPSVPSGSSTFNAQDLALCLSAQWTDGMGLKRDANVPRANKELKRHSDDIHAEASFSIRMD